MIRLARRRCSALDFGAPKVGLLSIHVTPRGTRTRAWLTSRSPRRSSVNSPKRSAHQDVSKISRPQPTLEESCGTAHP